MKIKECLSSVGVVYNSKKQILITQRNTEPFYQKWVMPGGKVDQGETPEKAVLREVKEEVGLEGTVGELLAKKEFPLSVSGEIRQYRVYFFEVFLEKEFEIQPNFAEVSDYAWVSRDSYESYDIAPRNKEVLDAIFLKTQ